MNIVLWILQALLSLHTLAGAFWKFSNPAQSMGSLSAIPQGVWLALSALEIVAGLALVAPVVHKPLGYLVPIAAGFIAAEMLLFCGVHLASGAGFNGQVVYWLVVAVVCAFVAVGRFSLQPLSAMARA